MKETKFALLKTSAVCGFLTPLIALFFISTAICCYPEFNWTENALSDLGVIAGCTSQIFNYGLIISGLLSFIFATGLFQYFNRNNVGRIGSTLFVLASISLISIGLFPENMKPIHYIVSVSFFVLIPTSMLIFALFFCLQKEKRIAVLTFLSAVAAATPWIFYFALRYVSGVAVPEALSAIVFSVWTLVLSFKMLRLSPSLGASY